LNVSLDKAVAVNATVTVAQPSIQNGQLVITGSISGSATVKGISATIPTQSIRLTASASCKAGTGTLTLSTSPLTVSLSNGIQATIAAQTLTVSATCGKTPTLTVSANPIKATISDGTVVSTSQCTVTVSSPSSTSLGAAICDFHDLICQLASLLAANGSVDDAVTLLNQVLTNVTTTLSS
jgi:hypothetical protein